MLYVKLATGATLSGTSFTGGHLLAGLDIAASVERGVLIRMKDDRGNFEGNRATLVARAC